ncbi:carbon-nitrogen hydrolase [Jaminaea rosea]|uniref:Carbon-nitrogen hydrolase n=1 Tax=Jaminaea rosea TaxID=1569628 RepID=A0A316UPW9_9BASI|nr:carbon-nitrogen hydrolase [Jaminaea rosea]PWN25185.1 carbon-nitrogen hydrolase [Jaminaea rosea]
MSSTSDQLEAVTMRTQGRFVHPSLPTHLHIAVAQLLPVSPSSSSSSPDAGLDKLRTYIAHAAKLGADLVVFPEYFLAGADHGDWYGVRERGGPRPHGHSAVEEKEEEEQEKHWLDVVCEEAKKRDINVVAGTVVELGHGQGEHHVLHRNEAGGSNGKGQGGKEEKLFNTAYFVGREGDVRGKYTKRNLWHPERAPLTPGHSSTHPHPDTFTFTTRRRPQHPITTGLRICWDLAFPSSFRELADASPPADIIIAPTCWYATDSGTAGLGWGNPFEGEGTILDALVTARSLEAECPVVMANVAGPGWPEGFRKDWAKLDEIAEREEWGPDDVHRQRIGLIDLHIERPGLAVGLGRSAIVSPFSGVIARLEDEAEGLLLGSVDLRIVDDIRKTYQIRKDLAAAAAAEEDDEEGRKRKKAT